MAFRRGVSNMKQDETFGPAERMPIWVDSRWRHFFFAPWNLPPGENIDIGNTFLAFVLEFVASLALGLFVGLARSAAPGPSSLTDGALIGLVYAAVFWTAWNWSTDYGLRRHMNWCISFAYVFTGQIGVVAWLIYAVLQTAGAMTAGAILFGLGNLGVVPNIMTAATQTNPGMVFGLLFLASFIVSFYVIYNDLFEQRKEEERENHARTGTVVSIAIFFLITTLYQFQIWTVGNVVYLAELFGTGDIVANADPADGITCSWCMYLGAPIVGAVAAIAIFWVAKFFFAMHPDYEPRRGPARNDPPTQQARLANKMKAGPQYYGVPGDARMAHFTPATASAIKQPLRTPFNRA